MQFRDTGCCGIREIVQLSNHPNAEDAMDAFCRELLGTGRHLYYAGVPRSPNGAYIYSFYLFTAAVFEGPDGKPLPNMEHVKKYGHEFAAFIKKNKFGSVSTLQARVNHAFHPDHQVQPWLWRPQMRTLKKWWAVRVAAEQAEQKLKRDAAIAAKQALAAAANQAQVLPNLGQLGVANQANQWVENPF